LTSPRCPKVLEEKESQNEDFEKIKKYHQVFIQSTIVPNLNMIALFLTSLGFDSKLQQTNAKKRRNTRCLSHHTFYFRMKQWYATLRSPYARFGGNYNLYRLTNQICSLHFKTHSLAGYFYFFARKLPKAHFLEIYWH